MLRRFRNKLQIAGYHFKHWFFQWIQDEEGDIGLMIAGRLCFIKYKEHTIIRWREYTDTSAPKHFRVVS